MNSTSFNLSSSSSGTSGSSDSLFIPDSTSSGLLPWAIVGGLFSLTAILVSSVHIRSHLNNNHDSQLRRYVVRILWMVPLYAAVAFLALVLQSASVIYLDVVRDFYESVVIWSFFQFCLVYLGGSVVLNEQLSRRAQVQHSWPFVLCLRPWSMEQRFLFHTRLGVTQYVVIKSLMAVVTFSLAAARQYTDGLWSFSSPYTYITILNNFSQGYALYALYLFYHATKTDLDRIRPVAKFLCVKLIIFATYWQSVVISFVTLAGTLQSRHDYSGSTAAAGQRLQNFLICIEMCVASFGHMYAFPSREFWSVDGGDEESRSSGVVSKVFDVMTPSDIVSDVRELTRMNKKYQQVHNEGDDLISVDRDDREGAGQAAAGGAAAAGGSDSSGPSSGRRKRGRKGGGAADEARRSFSLDGIEERMEKVKEELKSRQRERWEARRHMRATYSPRDGAEHSSAPDDDGDGDEEFDSALELHVDDDVDGEDEEEDLRLYPHGSGGSDEKTMDSDPVGSPSPSADSERGSSRSLVELVELVNHSADDRGDQKEMRGVQQQHRSRDSSS